MKKEIKQPKETKKFNLERLKGKKVAVNCVTEEQAQDFIKWICYITDKKFHSTQWVFSKMKLVIICIIIIDGSILVKNGIKKIIGK